MDRPQIDPASRPYRPLGAALKLFYCRDPEICIAGPAGTGKTIGALNKLHLCLSKYGGARGLLIRKTRVSLNETTLASFENKVLPENSPLALGCTRATRKVYAYPNGSTLVLGGMDNPIKVMSSEYDIIVADEATELEEKDHEALLSRLRNHVMPYQQAILCCNPDAPTHWIKQRCDAGKMTYLQSVHADNPSVTPDYLAMLDRLTGVRRLRLRDGVWAAAEGLIYDEFNPAVHVIHWDCRLGDFAEILASLDWGFTHAGVLQVWGLDSDRRLYLLREIVRCGQTIDWWVQQAQDQREQLGIGQFVADSARPDYIEQFNRAGLPTIGAYKSVAIGIQTLKERLRVQGDGKPRLMVLDDSLCGPCPLLVAAKRPCGMAAEMTSYVWAEKGQDQPLKENDHSCDAARYAVAYADNLAAGGINYAKAG